MAAAEIPSRHTCILVIHGIGQQNPYETLDSFSQGLVRYFNQRGHSPRLRPERISHTSWTEVALHLEFESPVTDGGLRRLSLFELYWSPYTQGKVTYRGVLNWLLRTALSPLRHLSNNLQALMEAKQKIDLTSIAGLFLREIWRALILYLPIALFAAVALFGLITTVPALQGLARAFIGLVRAEPNRLALAGVALCFLLEVYLLVFIVVQLLARFRRPSRGMESTAENWWLVLAGFFLLFFSALGFFLAQFFGIDLAAYLRPLLRWGNLWPVLAVVLLLLLRRVLVDYVGDVAVYTAADAKSAHYEARSAILRESTAALARLVANPACDRIILAGHSLGSVIAYDTLNRLLSGVWATSDPSAPQPSPRLTRDDLSNKIKGLVTFGSPLDKVYYFFRVHVKPDQPIRAQVLSFLHSFRRARSGRDYGGFKFTYSPADPPGNETSAFPELGAEFRWLNVWSRMDPVSGNLDFYRLLPDDQLHLWYPLWGVAHLS